MKPNHWQQWTDRLTRLGGDRVEDQDINQGTNQGLAQDGDQALVNFLREHRATPPAARPDLEADLWAAIAAEPQPAQRSSWFRSRWQLVLTGSVLVLGLGSLGLAWLMGSRSSTLQWANQNRPNLLAVANPPGDRQLRPVVRPGIQPALQSIGESIGQSTRAELAELGAIAPRTAQLRPNQVRLAELEHFFEAAWFGSLGASTVPTITARRPNTGPPADPSAHGTAADRAADTTAGTEAINDFFEWFNNLDEATDARRPVDSPTVSQTVAQSLAPQLFQPAIVFPFVEV